MSLKRNVVANYLGYGWAALMGIAFLPGYVKALGVAAYGLVGVYTVMHGWLGMLDMGLTSTLNREMARLRAGSHSAESIRDLLRSIELIFLVVATLMVLVIWAASGALVDHWLTAGALPRVTVIDAIRIIGFVLAARWLEQIYRAAILGMQDHVYLNQLQSISATLRWGGAYLVVTLVEPSILHFFVWQGLVSMLTTAMLMRRTYHLLPNATRRGRFNIRSLQAIKDFAIGMSLSSFLTFALTQADKIVIGKMLPIDQLGYYMLAASASGALLLVITPMNNAIYPRLTELEAAKDYLGLERSYRSACEWMSAILIPAALVLSFFSAPILQVWTGDAHLTSVVAPLLTVLALGTLFNGLMNVPYMLQLAHGWTSLTVKMNAIATLIIVPAIIFIVPRHGTLGAAAAWLVLNVASLIITSHFMYDKILPRAKMQWYRESIVLPLAAATLCAAAILIALPTPATRMGAALYVLVAFATVQLAVVCASKNLRKLASTKLHGIAARIAAG
jgi:O-antigen/teichoic acid export membrane protein